MGCRNLVSSSLSALLGAALHLRRLNVGACHELSTVTVPGACQPPVVPQALPAALLSLVLPGTETERLFCPSWCLSQALPGTVRAPARSSSLVGCDGHPPHSVQVSKQTLAGEHDTLAVDLEVMYIGLAWLEWKSRRAIPGAAIQCSIADCVACTVALPTLRLLLVVSGTLELYIAADPVTSALCPATMHTVGARVTIPSLGVCGCQCRLSRPSLLQ
jgi:hypothetical protein